MGDITHQIIDVAKRKKVENKDRGEYSAMCMLHLNDRSDQYGGFTPVQRVSGRTPKLSIGAVDARILKIAYTKMAQLCSIRRTF